VLTFEHAPAPWVTLGVLTGILMTGYTWTTYHQLRFFQSLTERARLLISAAIAVPTVSVLYACVFVLVRSLLLAADNYEQGKWPFPPLKQTHEEIALGNGGIIRIDGEVRDRSWKPSVDCNASYKPPNSDKYERITGWFPTLAHPSVFVVDGLVVVFHPHTTTMHVRTNEGVWRHFGMSFPREGDPEPLSYYVSATSLSEDDLQRIRNSPDDHDPMWGPSASIENFDPQNRHLLVNYHIKNTTKDLTLELAEDGTKLRLLGIREDSWWSTRTPN
jgi:hypothetical protein